MGTSGRIRTHLRSNVVGYVALFVALSGTAIAIPGKNNVTSKNIAAGAVKSKQIARGAVKGKALDEDAVKTQKVRNAAITGPKLAANAVAAAALAEGAVTTAALADGAVTTSKLPDDAVTRQKIVQGAINGGKLANASVDSAKVDNGSLLAEDFAAGQLSDGFVVAGASAGSFTIQRPGRVFVTAAFEPTCAVPCTYAVEIDDVAVPGATFNLPASVFQLTLTGVSAELATGPHNIELTGGADQPTLAGILLQ